MRFMMMMYPGIDTDAEGWEPSAEDVAAMTAYNEELTKAGVLLSLDGLLGLIFTCCHPLLSTEARVALTLRLLGGLGTEEIARAFLVSESTVAQRIVRAKRTLKEAHARFEVPEGEELDQRLVELNRSVAVGMAFGPEAGLELVDRLVDAGELAGYHLLGSVRADLLAKLGRAVEAREEFERAAAMTENARERELLLERAGACSA